MVFSSSSASQVNWAAGNIYIGADVYAISGANTSQLETLNSDGRKYYVYYKKGEDRFRVKSESDFKNIVAKKRDSEIKVIAHVHYDLPYAAWSMVGIKGGNVGDNTRVTGTQAQMRNFYADDGGAVLPGFSFSSDTDTGMYRTATGPNLSFAVAGTVRLHVHSSGISVTATTTTGTDAVITSAGVLAKKSSSKRYKENVVDTILDSSKIYDLLPVDFDWKKDVIIEGKNPRRDFGLIAEDVEKLYPKLVQYNKEGQVESVSYDRLSLLLLMEIKN